MPGHVRQRLGRDPVRRHLDRGRQRVQARPAVDPYGQARRPQPVGLLADRAEQPDVVQRGRAQVVHQPPDVGQSGRDVLAGLAQHVVGAVG